MKNKKIWAGSLLVFGVGVIALLVACGKPSAARAIYKCGDDVTLTVVFTEGKNVQVDIGDKGYLLDRIESASGARYEKDDVAFWSKGMEANFIEKKGGRVHRCRRG